MLQAKALSRSRSRFFLFQNTSASPFRVLRTLGACLAILAPLTLLSGCDYRNSYVVALSPLAKFNTSPNHVSAPTNLFDSNSTSVDNNSSDNSTGSAGFPGTLLARVSDCSVAAVTYSNYQLTSGSYGGAFSGTFTATVTPNYSATLHTLSGLTTKTGVFPNGCTDKTSGINGLASVLLAHTTAGKYVAAGVDLNNNLYIGAADPAGTVSGARLSLTNIFTLYAGDPNSEGVRQLIANGGVTLPTGGFSNVLYTINVHADGTYDAPVTLTTPSFFGGVVIDDFNGDGKADIGFTPVVGQANSTAMPFTVLPGKGDGTFGAAITSVAPTGTASTALTGDFNGDGKRDILTGTSLLLGNGDGTFTLSANTPPAGVTAVGDLNGDGKDDLVVVTSSYAAGSISIYLGNGDGTFTVTGPSYASIYGGLSVSITDIDGDGHPDLVVGLASNGVYVPPQYGQGMIMFLLGNGDGTFHGAYNYVNSTSTGVSHGAFAAGDFNGDGNIDVLAFAQDSLGNTHGIKLLTGNGKGLLTPQPVNTSVVPLSIAAADLNGDKKLDAIVETSSTDPSGNISVALSVLKGNGDGTFAAPTSFPIGTALQVDSILALGDTRASGQLDAVVNMSGSLYYLKGNGDGTFAAATQIDSQTDFGSLVLADVNGDGKADIVATAGTVSFGSLSSGKLLVYLSNGNGTFASPVTIANLSNAGDMIVTDLNKDTKLDIAYLSSDPATGAYSINVMLGNGAGGFASAVVSAIAGQNLTNMAAADFNGDGNPDLLIGSCCGDTLASIAYGNGDGTFTANAGLSIGPSTNFVGFADLNNDGRPDLLLATNQNLVTSLNEFGLASTAPTLAATTTTLTLSPTAPTAGQSVSFTATVAPTTGNGSPSGTVTFLDGTTTLGTGTLSSGTASFTGSLAAGTHSITASYGGDTTYAASISTADNLTITSAPTLAATTTQLTGSPTTASSGTSINFKASVSETSGTATPTGTVTFSDGTTPLGAANLASGVATFSTAALSVGTHNITAAYGGDTINAASSSSMLVITITATPADFSIALSSSSGSVSQGSSVTSTLTVTPSGGFNQAVSFTCAGLPANSTCAFSPVSVTLNGTSASTSTLTIATDTSATFLNTKPFHTPGETTSLAMLASGGSLVMLLLRRRRIDPRLLRLQMSLVAAFLLTFPAIGCGHGNSTTTTTPKGTSQITVTATAGSTVHTATYGLTVQ